MARHSEAEVIANRDEPIPVVEVTSPQDGPPNMDWPVKPKKRSRSPRERMRNKLDEKLEELSISDTESTTTRRSIQDRLFNKVLEHLVPTEPQENDEELPVKDRRSRKYVNRPGFSLPTMSSNFRRFNARIGVAFVLQNRLIRLFSWAIPTQTLSFLAVYSFVCLDPNLLAVIPLASCLFFIMVPAYISRHPPPPNSDPLEMYPLHGPPMGPAKYIKPAPDLSKDFFRNMRDLQNSMEDFSRLHDAGIALIAPLTNFSNEAISSTVFLALAITSCALFLFANLIPWRLLFLVIGWTITCLGHPRIQELIQREKTQHRIEIETDNARLAIVGFAASDNILQSDPELREIEVFELQRRHPAWDINAPFEHFIFCPLPFDPLAPSRISGAMPRGTPFFEDVKPPTGWDFVDKKWTLDLLSAEWVGERCITGVEVETEGERWVSDIQYESNDTLEEELFEGTRDRKKKLKKASKEPPKAWEEGNGTGKKGEWRRRRWIRSVRRKSLDAGTSGDVFATDD